MQKAATHIVISYFVIVGAQLISFSVLEIDAPLWQSLLIALIFTIVSSILGLHGERQWTQHASDNSSTIETASTAS